LDGNIIFFEQCKKPGVVNSAIYFILISESQRCMPDFEWLMADGRCRIEFENGKTKIPKSAIPKSEIRIPKSEIPKSRNPKYLCGHMTSIYHFLLYIDPGSGSYLVQVIAAAVLSIVFFFKNLKLYIKDLFRRLFRRNEKKDDKDPQSLI
jgi:hypothetical protein